MKNCVLILALLLNSFIQVSWAQNPYPNGGLVSNSSGYGNIPGNQSRADQSMPPTKINLKKDTCPFLQTSDEVSSAISQVNGALSVIANEKKKNPACQNLAAQVDAFVVALNDYQKENGLSGATIVNTQYSSPNPNPITFGGGAYPGMNAGMGGAMPEDPGVGLGPSQMPGSMTSSNSFTMNNSYENSMNSNYGSTEVAVTCDNYEHLYKRQYEFNIKLFSKSFKDQIESPYTKCLSSSLGEANSDEQALDCFKQTYVGINLVKKEKCELSTEDKENKKKLAKQKKIHSSVTVSVEMLAKTTNNVLANINQCDNEQIKMAVVKTLVSSSSLIGSSSLAGEAAVLVALGGSLINTLINAIVKPDYMQAMEKISSEAMYNQLACIYYNTQKLFCNNPATQVRTLKQYAKPCLNNEQESMKKIISISKDVLEVTSAIQKNPKPNRFETLGIQTGKIKSEPLTADQSELLSQMDRLMASDIAKERGSLGPYSFDDFIQFDILPFYEKKAKKDVNFKDKTIELKQFSTLYTLYKNGQDAVLKGKMPTETFEEIRLKLFEYLRDKKFNLSDVVAKYYTDRNSDSKSDLMNLEAEEMASKIQETSFTAVESLSKVNFRDQRELEIAMDALVQGSKSIFEKKLKEHAQKDIATAKNTRPYSKSFQSLSGIITNCILTAGMHHMNANGDARASANIKSSSVFDDYCEPFLCENGVGLPKLKLSDDKENRRQQLEDYQCTLINNYDRIVETLRIDYTNSTNPGTFCGGKNRL